jgi:dTDP-glucose 4,6-dehydratase
MRLLITGAAGFIGSHFLEFALDINSKTKMFEQIIVVDSLTYASDVSYFKFLQSKYNFTFFQYDISDSKALINVIGTQDYIVNFAAESHVDKSLEDSSKFIKSNVLGLGNLLEISRHKEITKFIQVSTDEVYGSIDVGSWDESCRVDPNSPYSASKAAADLIAISFNRSHKMPIMITRSSNNFGPRQNIEKFIPVVIMKILKGEKIPLYGTGENIRDWIFVEDNVLAIWEVLLGGQSGEIYNIGGKNELSNLEMISLIGTTMSKKPNIVFVDDRKAHDFRYSISTEKIENIFSFRPKFDLEEGIKKTIYYYENKYGNS